MIHANRIDSPGAQVERDVSIVTPSIADAIRLEGTTWLYKCNLAGLPPCSSLGELSYNFNLVSETA